MDEITSITAKEVVSILYNSDMNIFMKIPPKFISFLETKASDCKDEVEINRGVEIENQTISDDAKAILAIIYKDFLTTKDQKEKLEKELAEIVESDYKENIEEDKSIEMVIHKEESRIKKILNRIKSFFSKK